jgi:long-chain fatty acid transport protein
LLREGYRNSRKGKAKFAGKPRIGARISNFFSYLISSSAIILSCASPAPGAGFALLQQGTAAMAQGNAFVADASDASAIFYNPAGLNQLKTPTVYQGVFINYPDREFSGGGLSSQTAHRFYHATSVYLAVPAHPRVALGIGFFSPFGLGTIWPPPWAGRYVTTFSSLKTYNLNPVVSVKVLDNLSLAAGFDVMWSRVQLKRKRQVFVGPRQFPDGEVRLTGDGNGFGYNLGALYEPVSGLKLGVSYRSKIFVDHKGQAALNLPPPLPSSSASGRANLEFPPSLTMGVSCRPIQPFALEFDTTWTGWSSYDNFIAKFDGSIAGTTGQRIPKRWHDSWAFRFGANYEVKEGMKVRAGYIYDMTPVPDGTMDPQVPDANRHIFTAGGELKVFKRFTLGIAYNFILAETRFKDNTITINSQPLAPQQQANGRYNSTVHSLGLSWQFQF